MCNKSRLQTGRLVECFEVYIMLPLQLLRAYLKQSNLSVIQATDMEVCKSAVCICRTPVEKQEKRHNKWFEGMLGETSKEVRNVRNGFVQDNSWKTTLASKN